MQGNQKNKNSKNKSKGCLLLKEKNRHKCQEQILPMNIMAIL